MKSYNFKESKYLLLILTSTSGQLLLKSDNLYSSLKILLIFWNFGSEINYVNFRNFFINRSMDTYELLRNA